MRHLTVTTRKSLHLLKWNRLLHNGKVCNLILINRGGQMINPLASKNSIVLHRPTFLVAWKPNWLKTGSKCNAIRNSELIKCINKDEGKICHSVLLLGLVSETSSKVGYKCLCEPYQTKVLCRIYKCFRKADFVHTPTCMLITHKVQSTFPTQLISWTIVIKTERWKVDLILTHHYASKIFHNNMYNIKQVLKHPSAEVFVHGLPLCTDRPICPLFILRLIIIFSHNFILKG